MSGLATVEEGSTPSHEKPAMTATEGEQRRHQKMTLVDQVLRWPAFGAISQADQPLGNRDDELVMITEVEGSSDKKEPSETPPLSTRDISHYVEVYRQRTFPVYPFLNFEKLRLACNSFAFFAKTAHNRPQYNLHYALALLVIALGQLHEHGLSPGSLSTPGRESVDKALRILAREPGGCSIFSVQAKLLATIYMCHVLEINSGIRCLESACLALEISMTHRPEVDEEEKNLRLFAYWTCLDLHRVIHSQIVGEFFPLCNVGFWTWERPELPGDTSIGIAPEAAKEVCRHFNHRIRLRRQQMKVLSTSYPLNPDVHHVPDWDEMARLEAELVGTRLMLRGDSWEDTEGSGQVLSPEKASLRALFYETRFLVWLPALQYAQHNPDAATEYLYGSGTCADAAYRYSTVLDNLNLFSCIDTYSWMST